MTMFTHMPTAQEIIENDDVNTLVLLNPGATPEASGEGILYSLGMLFRSNDFEHVRITISLVFVLSIVALLSALFDIKAVNLFILIASMIGVIVTTLLWTQPTLSAASSVWMMDCCTGEGRRELKSNIVKHLLIGSASTLTVGIVAAAMMVLIPMMKVSLVAPDMIMVILGFTLAHMVIQSIQYARLALAFSALPEDARPALAGGKLFIPAKI